MKTFELPKHEPKYVGGYRVGGDDAKIMFPFVRKPRAIHRWFCRLLLGWVWVDQK